MNLLALNRKENAILVQMALLEERIGLDWFFYAENLRVLIRQFWWRNSKSKGKKNNFS